MTISIGKHEEMSHDSMALPETACIALHLMGNRSNMNQGYLRNEESSCEPFCKVIVLSIQRSRSPHASITTIQTCLLG